ncbi:unnamed protein product [Cercopithifilaria johnstoni]|uniref:Major sperm protein n=1 Tax=Cercopithifilaria johnstoni TaxID=2874296 RepID=A0A8J2Q5I2_9BILA|nr:unnamed protein product [Cercopithifilaria johnstoni]
MSYLQCTPAVIQLPCAGGTTTHVLEAIGTERLAFKVKLKQKYYDLYRVSPPLGFVKPGVKKELFLRRLPGNPGRTKLVVEYIASPDGYDPRKPFVEGAEVGKIDLRVIAYSDKKLPDDKPSVMGKVVTKKGQKFIPPVGYDDLKLETEIDELFKDENKAVTTAQILAKEKEGKGKVKKEAKGKVGKEGKKKKDESSSTSDENAPIQVVLPNLWKDLDINKAQNNNDQLKAILDVIMNENRRMEEIIKHMMQEITFLRESLLSTVMKLATLSLANKEAAAATLSGSGQPTSTASTMTGKSVGVGSDARITSEIKTTIPTGVSHITSPVAVGSSTTTGVSHKTSSVAEGSGATTGVSHKTSSVAEGSGATTGVSPITSPVAGGSGATTGVSRTTSPVASTANGVKSAIGVGEGGALSHTGAGVEVENYLSAMLAEGGPGGKAKGSDDGSPAVGGGTKEFSLYLGGAAGGRDVGSAYFTASSAAKAKKDLAFAFGSTADQLGGSGHPYSPSGSSGGSGGGGGHGASSVYL